MVPPPERCGRRGLFACALLFGLSGWPCNAEEGPSDWELWSGGTFRFNRPEPLEMSIEYQVRLDEDLKSLKSQFFELQGYDRVKQWFELSGAYRLVFRPDHTEHRLMLGAWLRQTLGEGRPSIDSNSGLDLVHQVAYQRDFNVQFSDDLIDSNSARWVVTATKPLGARVAPHVLIGALATWNEEYAFGLDKLRIGAGIQINHTANSRFRVVYILEESRATDPHERSNIIWVRCEMFSRPLPFSADGSRERRIRH